MLKRNFRVNSSAEDYLSSVDGGGSDCMGGEISERRVWNSSAVMFIWKGGGIESQLQEREGRLPCGFTNPLHMGWSNGMGGFYNAPSFLCPIHEEILKYLE
jgi:hypothetical protein